MITETRHVRVSFIQCLLTILSLLLGLFALYRMRTSAVLSLEEQGEYKPITLTSPVALEMAPRFEGEEGGTEQSAPVTSSR